MTIPDDQSNAATRLGAADVRDAAADSRDTAARARDVAADLRDRRMVDSDIAEGVADDLVWPGDPAAGTREIDALDGAAGRRRRGAEQRVLAAHDRHAAAADHERAATDRLSSLADRQWLVDQLAVADTDQLTRALARPAGLRALELELERANRTSSSLVVAYVDVVGLKARNDADGHEAGDALLVSVVALVRRHLRPYDLAVRLGGDEFLFVMPGITLAGATLRFARAADELADTAGARGITTGFAEFVPGETAQVLIARADDELAIHRRVVVAPEPTRHQDWLGENAAHARGTDTAPPAADDDSRLLHRAVASTGSGVTVADATLPGFPLSYVNPAFEELTGYSSAECLGRNCAFLQGRDTDPAAVAELSAALAEGREARVVLLNNRKDGTPFFNELRLSPVFDARGRVVQVVGVQHDVSGLVRDRRALEADRDRAVAELRVFQDALTPAGIPRRPGLEIAGAFAAAAQGVAGDFHLVAAGAGGSTLLALGDATGHGLHAARHAVLVRTMLSTFAPAVDDPQRLLEMVNAVLVEKAGPSTEFVTAVCAIYDPATRRLRWASAGHGVPIALDTGMPIGPLADVGVALGIRSGLSATLREVHLPVGAGLLLASDGLEDARPPREHDAPVRRFGKARVRDVLRELRGQPARATSQGLQEAVDDHAHGHYADDLSVLVIRAS